MSKTTLTAIPGMHDLKFTRTFDAPIERVFKAFIDPDSVAEIHNTLRQGTTVTLGNVQSVSRTTQA